MPRSPNYPDMGLDEAISRIEQFWTLYKQAPVPIEVAAKGLGYKGLNGRSQQKISAVRKYGLIERSGEDYRLSDISIKIIIPVEEGEREEAIAEAARKIKIFQEISERYGDAPDEAIRPYLLRSGFSETGAKGVINAYRGTLRALGNAPIRYNGDTESDISEEPEPDMPQSPPTATISPDAQPAAPSGQRAVPLPISSAEWPMLHVPYPMSNQAWDEMIAVLTALKGGIVGQPAKTTESAAPDSQDA